LVRREALLQHLGELFVGTLIAKVGTKVNQAVT